MSKRFLAVAAVFILAFVLLMPISNSNAQAPYAPLVSSSTRFRVVIAEPLSTSANIYLDGVIVNVTPTPLPTPTPQPTPSPMVVAPLNVSGYVNTTAGSHTITLTQAGTTTAFTGVGPFTFVPAALTNYTLILLPGNIWITVLDVNPAPASLSSNARVINLWPSTSVTVAIDGTVPATGFTNIPYQSTNSTTSVYAPISAAVHTITVTGTGVTSNPKSFTFVDGHVYTIFIFNNTPNLVILPKSDTNFLAGVTPTAPVPTNTPTPIGTVVVPAGPKIFLPMITR